MTAAAASPEPPIRDGRRARRDRSRDQAVDALLELLEEGVPRPTAQQVAERSGVSLRSIFRIFDDVDTLHSAAASRQLERVRHLYVDVPATGSLPERVEAVVRFHDHLYAEVGQIRRAAHRSAAESEVMRSQLQMVRAWLVGQIERVFAAELDGTDPSVVRAAELALSFEAWDHLATAQALGPDDRRATVSRTVLAVLTSP